MSIPISILLLLSAASHALEPVFSDNGLAIRGYDPVAYFESERAVEGNERFSYDWMGATWRFASQEHRARFADDPSAFAPQYGGYCAWAVADGGTAPVDPHAWKIVEGKLYLNYSPRIQRKWLRDVPRHIAKADANWPRLKSR